MSKILDVIAALVVGSVLLSMAFLLWPVFLFCFLALIFAWSFCRVVELGELDE